jgi:hypothetical protein
VITSDCKAIGKKPWGSLPSAFGDGKERDDKEEEELSNEEEEEIDESEEEEGIDESEEEEGQMMAPPPPSAGAAAAPYALHGLTATTASCPPRPPTCASPGTRRPWLPADHPNSS